MLAEKVNNFNPEKLTDQETDSALISLNLKNKEIEAHGNTTDTTVLSDEKGFLTSVYQNSSTHAGFDVIGARTRYKSD